jgi:hypothetical protein
MDDFAATRRVIDAIETAGASYMVVGALSSNIFGVLRSTKDADIVVEFGHRSIREIMANLDSQFRLEPQMRFETITGTARYIINVADSAFVVEIFRLSNDPHDQERFRRRLSIFTPQLERSVNAPTAEDVIITKLRWSQHAGRHKDRDDVRDVIAVQADNLDWPYIRRWTDEHGTTALLDEIRRSIPPI